MFAAYVRKACILCLQRQKGVCDLCLQRQKGVYLVKKAFGLANYVDCRGNTIMTTEQAIARGNQAIEDSIVIFDEVSRSVYHDASEISPDTSFCCVRYSCTISATELCLFCVFQLHDLGHKAEAVMTKAVLCRYDFNFQIKVLVYTRCEYATVSHVRAP